MEDNLATGFSYFLTPKHLMVVRSMTFKCLLD